MCSVTEWITPGLTRMHCSCFLMSADFFQNQHFVNVISVIILGPDHARRFVGADLDPNCLQKLSADGTRS